MRVLRPLNGFEGARLAPAPRQFDDFGSALFRLDAPQPARDPGVQSLRREDGWERHHEDNRRERELAFGSSRLVPLYAALGSP
jgi:hypothetical protein